MARSIYDVQMQINAMGAAMCRPDRIGSVGDTSTRSLTFREFVNRDRDKEDRAFYARKDRERRDRMERYTRVSRAWNYEPWQQYGEWHPHFAGGEGADILLHGLRRWIDFVAPGAPVWERHFYQHSPKWAENGEIAFVLMAPAFAVQAYEMDCGVIALKVNRSDSFWYYDYGRDLYHDKPCRLGWRTAECVRFVEAWNTEYCERKQRGGR